MKQIVKGAKAREALVNGICEVAEAVETTLGPRGKNMALSFQYGGPQITNDGVTGARNIEIDDPILMVGVDLAKEVCMKANDIAGDGSTTTLVVLKALVKGAQEKQELGTTPMGVRSGIEMATGEALEILDASAIKIKTLEEIKQVATISAESEEIGEIIAETVREIGQHGTVAVEESTTFGIEKEIVEGMQFDKGFVSPYMVTDAERMEAVYENSYVLVIDKKLESIEPIVPLLNQLKQEGIGGLTIIAHDFDQAATGALVQNKMRNVFSGLAIKAPGYGNQTREMLEDLAILTGAEVIGQEGGVLLDKVQKKHLGRVRKVIAKQDKTTFIGGKGDKAAVKARVDLLQGQLDNADAGFDKERLQERLAKLTGGVAVLRVGAPTETEMKYLKLKIEDAVNATKAAVEHGIVPGGGMALFRVAKKLSVSVGKKKLSASERVGYEIVIGALVAPVLQILKNADVDPGVLEDLEDDEKSGYDAKKGVIVKDMIKAGIIDPVLVTRTALERSASVAGLVITTETLIAYIPQKAEDKKS